jgi:adenylate cyclase
MSEERVERRLAAILAADVAGYSRLMEADEEGTLRRLRTHRRELIDPKIAAHRGRIVKTTGDGLLGEFPSVVDAMRCALELQGGMAERNIDIAPDLRIEFRIGIHQGDIVVEDGDIFGDGVNIAARLEALAEPGGVCVSARVREDAAGKLDLAFRDMGEQRLHNIARPVRAYAVGGTGARSWRSRRTRRWPLIVAASVPLAPAIGAAAWRVWPLLVTASIVLVAVIGVTAWWVWPRVAPPTTAQAPTPPPLAADAKPAPRLSIVVLPFANLSGDPDQSYFSDGITEDLTTDLSRIRNLLVIARNSAFTYKDKPINVKQIGHELGVRYVLEGSVRRSGNTVRVNAQLIDADTGAHLWADRFDRDIGDLFALQDEVTSRIGNTLGWELIRVEAARPTERPDALDYIFRGRAEFAKRGGDDLGEVIRLFESALAADPRSLEARSRLAQTLVRRGIYSDPAVQRDNFARAEGLIAEVLAVSPRDPLAHSVRAYLLQSQRRCAEAIPEYEAATGVNWGLGLCKFLVGAPDQEAIALIEEGIRRSPRDPSIGLFYGLIGWIHLMQSRVDEAIVWLEKGRRAGGRFYTVLYSLAAAYGLKGEGERAAAELAEAMRLTGDRYSTIAKFRANDALYAPAVRDRFENVYLVGLRKAGLPEE